MVLGLIPVEKLVTRGNHLGAMQNQTYFRQALSTATASPRSSDRMTKGDRRLGPLRVSDRVMTCHDLLGLQISKLSFLVKKGSRSSQHGVHRRVLGCFWKGEGSARIHA